MFRRIAAVAVLIALAGATAAQAVSDRYLPVEPDLPPAATWIVSRGDHFWSIAERHLAQILARRPDTNEVAAYWRELVAENLPGIKSADADLIFPGEVVTLP